MVRLKPLNPRGTDQPKIVANSHNTTTIPLGLLLLLIIVNILTMFLFDPCILDGILDGC